MCSKAPWDPKSVVMHSITTDVPRVIKLEDDSYAYLDATDDASIMHSMCDTTMGLKEKLISKILISSTMHNAQIGEDKADCRTLISDERHS